MKLGDLNSIGLHNHDYIQSWRSIVSGVDEF